MSEPTVSCRSRLARPAGYWIWTARRRLFFQHVRDTINKTEQSEQLQDEQQQPKEAQSGKGPTDLQE